MLTHLRSLAMKTFEIIESYTGFVKYEVIANNEEQAMQLYENGEYTEIDISGTDRYQYKFISIKEG